MSEHHVTLYLHGIEPDALIAWLGACRTEGQGLGEGLRPDRAPSYGHPLDAMLGPDIQVDLPGAVGESADEEADIPF
ncbi:MAG: hypothetical protein H6737_13895 [Alphaproteobacteria bacterium]|nr:hypothetical protein [Alphaproteobacteria bacterium]